MSLVTKMTMDQLLSIRKMKRKEAEDFIAKFDLTEDEAAAARDLMQEEEPVDPRMDQRMWVVVAYLLGASLRMIARDKGGVSPQSVYAQIERVIPDTKERGMMRYRTALSYEAMAEYKVKYFENIDQLRGKSPADLAKWLVENTSLDTDASYTREPDVQ
jgi:hypothetical protein